MQNRFLNLTLLYAEDDIVIRQNAVEYLSSYFKEVFQAKDGQEAYEIYQKVKPDIIISDIEMPRLNGLDLVKKIRQNNKTIPVIITTAFTDTSYLLQAVELQLLKYITKPINSKKLKEALTLLLDHLNINNVLTIDTHKCYDGLNKTLVVDKKLVKLTSKELKLFDLLAKNHNRVVSYEEIENSVWYDDAMSKDALRSLVRTVKIKLKGDYIDNFSGFGYKLQTAGEGV